jgi:BirA family biotin operon repressor/biotin-[acetyl-CoA-carboxylase] ligase
VSAGASRQHRHLPVAVSAEAIALAWARQEAAPAGAVVVVDHEISPRGRLGRLWERPQERTATLAMVWRPTLPLERADLAWAAASLGLVRALDAHIDGAPPRLWWPDQVIDESGRVVGAVRAEIQLGPGQITSAVVTARVDLDAVGAPDRTDVLALVEVELARVAGELDGAPQELPLAWEVRSALTGRRVIAHLLPRGEVRGTVAGVDPQGALELVSATGLRQRVPILGLNRVSIP